MGLSPALASLTLGLLATLAPTTATHEVVNGTPRLASAGAACEWALVPAREEGLGLNRAGRGQIQQGLRSEGFDPGGADGQFGPRTRAAIRNWQSARGARGTGYLDAAAATALQSTAVARFQVAEAATAPQQSTPATAAQENLFWQSIINSTNPADFEAYLEQFPNGVFRRLAENWLTTLRAQPAETPSGGAPRVGPPTSAAADARLPTSRLAIDFGDDTGEVQDHYCPIELESRPA